MKRVLIAILLAVGVGVGVAGPTLAANCFVKELHFSADGVLPSSQPDFEFSTNTGMQEGELFSVVDGFLEQTTCGVGAGRANYSFPDASVSGGGLDSSCRTILEARLRIDCLEAAPPEDEGGAFFQAFDGANRFSVLFQPGGLKVPGIPDLLVAVEISEPHTYRLESPGNSSELMLFIDGELEGVTTAPAHNLNGFNFGDGITADGNNADASWNFIRMVQGPTSPKDKVYWTEQGSAKIQRANSDGTNVEDLVTDLGTPYGIAIDLPAMQMYWCDATARKIQRANLDGSCVQDLITSGIFLPHGIDLDIVGGKMYWVDRIADKVQRANLDGTEVEDLVVVDGGGDIALDPAGGKMYWATQNTDEIARANLDGTGVESLISTMNPSGIALDLEAGKIYWTISGSIQRANLDGSDEEILVAGLSLPREINLDLNIGKMYWTDQTGGVIQRANLDGSEVEDLVTGLSSPNGIALDPPDVPVDVVESGHQAHGVRLLPNYPNPFNSSTTISYVLPAAESVRLVIYDVAGREVRTLTYGEVKPAGRHAVRWDGKDDAGHNVTSGVYLYKLKAAAFTQERRALLLH